MRSLRQHLRLARRLFGDERGISLVMAMGIMLALSTTGTAVVAFSTSNARSAEVSADSSAASHAAEAGVNQALAVLSNPANNPLKPDLLSGTTVTVGEGSTTWSGTFDYTTMEWTITSTGTMSNPTGGADLTRTTTATAPVTVPLTGSPASESWDYIYSDTTGDPDGCDMYVKNNVGPQTRLYVNGNLCLKNNTKLEGGPIIVHGTIDVENNADIGEPANRPEVYVDGAGGMIYCKYGIGPWRPTCGDTEHVYSVLAGTSIPGVNLGSAPVIPMPAVDWDASYEAAIPGPAIDCTSTTGARTGSPPVFDNNYPVMDVSAGTFDLTPNSSYTCRVGPAGSPAGELSWDAPSQTLTISGTIFIDGNAMFGNKKVNQYDGTGVIYVSGVFLMDVNTKMCAGLTGSGKNAGCDVVNWDPGSEMLVIAAQSTGGIARTGNGILLDQNTQFEGGLYAEGNIEIENNSATHGPMVANSVEFINNATTDTFPLITNAPIGVPGTEVTTWGAQVGKPQIFPN